MITKLGKFVGCYVSLVIKLLDSLEMIRNDVEMLPPILKALFGSVGGFPFSSGSERGFITGVVDMV